MNRQAQQILLHSIGCIVFLSLPLLFSPESLSLRAYLKNPPTQRDIISYLLVLGIFHVNYYAWIPRLYFQRKFILYILTNISGNPTSPDLSHPEFTNPNHPDIPGFSNPGPTHSRFFLHFNQHLSIFLILLFLALVKDASQHQVSITYITPKLKLYAIIGDQLLMTLQPPQTFMLRLHTGLSIISYVESVAHEFTASL